MSDASPGGVESRPRRVEPVSLGAVAAVASLPDPGPGMVTGVSLDSSRVRPGDLYCALPGRTTHGVRFSTAAVRAGAVAILTDPGGRELAAAAGVPVLVAETPRLVLGAVSALVYGRPAEQLRLLGFTGTQGKTTTAHLAEAGVHGCDLTAAVVGTTGTRLDGRPVASALTTPEAPDLHALLAVMVEHGVDVCAMEVSSHALVQQRVAGVRFDVATFLNLGHDHLDFHKTFENYFAAKAALFEPASADRAVVNVDDRFGRRLASRLRVPMAGFSAAGAAADWRVSDASPTAIGSRFTVCAPGDRRLPASVPLPGGFNVANALAAIAALGELGLPLEEVVGGIARAPGVPGRMQRVDAGQRFSALVDYAHKPEALAAVLDALRPVTSGRVIVVLGAGGNRDRTKRPAMGRIASERADVVVVTDDNPRGEDAAAIRAALLGGARTGRAVVTEIPDRATAIEHAAGLAGPGDCVLVAGKGHEATQEVGDHAYPFDDRTVLRDALERLVPSP